ncbi:MAG: PadR family transcriptional regulator [Woeseiaceae bacterium]
MSLKHIMLGMLREPHSGYDIKKTFEKSLRSFWRAELSQIYPLLQKMEGEGLLTSKDSASEKGPTRRVYKRSAKGRQELQSWLLKGPVVGTERIGYLAQTYFLANLRDDDKAIEFMEDLRTYMSDWLASLEEAEDEWRANDPGYPNELSDEAFYPQLTLDLGLTKLRASVDWCDRSIERIRARQSDRHVG